MVLMIELSERGEGRKEKKNCGRKLALMPAHRRVWKFRREGARRVCRKGQEQHLSLYTRFPRQERVQILP